MSERLEAAEPLRWRGTTLVYRRVVVRSVGPIVLHLHAHPLPPAPHSFAALELARHVVGQCHRAPVTTPGLQATPPPDVHVP
ncbi:hypothetical protein [Salinigranum rubrum]|uniref:hypothetical protein n=1 Tax=Salinigranum rubrum TaxID=755307 RepID=UPI0013A59270|nr:hypothetical protein [Salinigranum rubrum]